MASIARTSLLRQASAMAAAPVSRLAPTARASPARLLRMQAQPQLFQKVSRIAAFHASSRRDLLPHGPQVVHGTVNDPVPIPAQHPSHGSYHWTFERLVAASLVPLTLTPFAAGSLNPTLDAVLCATILIHTHLGLGTVVSDYVNTWDYATLRKICNWALNAATALVGLGLYEFETNDVGLTELVSRVWKA